MPAVPVNEIHLSFLVKCKAGEKRIMKSSSLTSSLEAINGLIADFAPAKDFDEIPKTLESYSPLTVAEPSILPKSPSIRAFKLKQAVTKNSTT